MKLPKLYQLGVRYPKTVLTVFASLTVLSFLAARELKIESDLTTLLPKNSESVQNLNLFKDYFGGASYLFITVEGENPDDVSRFADDMSRRIEALPAVLYVDYRRPIDFFKKRMWLYLDVDDLLEMEKRTDRALELQQEGLSPYFNPLMVFADPENRPDLTFKDIFNKYRNLIGDAVKEKTADDSGRFVVMRIKARQNSENMDASRLLLAQIKSIERDTRRAFPHIPLDVGYTGGYQNRLEQVDQIKKEIGFVSALVLFVLFFILLFYFKRISAPLLVGIPLVISLVGTAGLVFLLLGHLNVITGFGAAILGGLGSDYGIYLLTRYYHEREEGTPFLKACDRAFSNTGRATHASMVTTMGAFGALLFSKFGVFVEFGIVGALGLLTTYLAMMLVIPALLTLIEKSSWKKRLARWDSLFSSWHPPPHRTRWLIEQIFRPRHAVPVLLAVFVLFGLSSLTLPSQSKIYFENGQMDDKNLPSNKLYERVSQVVHASLNPTVLMVKGFKEQNHVVRVLDSLINRDAEKKLVFNQVAGLSTFIPENQEEKKKILLSLESKLKKIFGGNQDKYFASLHDSLVSSPVTLENLPTAVSRIFISPKDPDVFCVFVFPALERSSLEKINLYRAGLDFLKNNLGLSFMAADGSFVAADTVAIIKEEAPRGFMLLIIFLALVLFVIIRPLTRAFVILGHLLAGLVLLSGVLWLCGIHLNVMNVAMIAIILGTGIDSYIHFSHRFDESGDMDKTLRGKILAIIISNLTTIVGFGGLIFTSSIGLRSISWVCVWGLVIVTLLAVFVFPRVLVLAKEPAKKMPVKFP